MCIRILKFRNTANLEHQTGDNSHPDPQIQEKPAQILDDPHPAPQISGDADPEALILDDSHLDPQIQEKRAQIWDDSHPYPQIQEKRA